ncbi:unnamed protein product [Caenorhabditis nigoni]
MTDREFFMTGVFTDLSTAVQGDIRSANTEIHFGLPWIIKIKREVNNFLGMCVYCPINKNNGCTIETRESFQVMSVNGNTRSHDTRRTYQYSTLGATGPTFLMSMSWDEMMSSYAVDGVVTISVTVEILRVIGIERQILRNFDESTKYISDLVLKVEDKKFHVSRLFLAGQSPVFKAMFLGSFEESKKDEIVLKDTSASDFQIFLEALHGEQSIEDETVNGILTLADKYNTTAVRTQLETFLIRDSRKSTREKLKLAKIYNFNRLKNKCLTGIKTMNDIRDCLAGNLSDMDQSVVSALLQKAVTFNQK